MLSVKYLEKIIAPMIKKFNGEASYKEFECALTQDSKKSPNL